MAELRNSWHAILLRVTLQQLADSFWAIPGKPERLWHTILLRITVQQQILSGLFLENLPGIPPICPEPLVISTEKELQVFDNTALDRTNFDVGSITLNTV